ncbi:prsA [Wigglesworthia glossinidia endosymbiont of Glossina brevipalpis]|uniref:Ribose-phosphate pyrophosphokinase n=1 Tax=Wigglesworthia glossinidia brevipalpis TaxID=36870 RepID=Q8D2K5_WIGBR|nr:prsA [Wigglesworthia glossinidia endosymbiont of Glossina brevipalpis]
MKIFSGSSNIKLSNKIANLLGISISNSEINKFQDGEINIKINENVRGEEVFIIQSMCFPVNDNFMELVITADALKRASAKKIIAVIPYLGYSRQDRRVYNEQVPITAKMIANLLAASGICHVIIVDLHCEQIQGFFDIILDSITTENIFFNDIISQKLNQPVLVSPDFGGMKRVRRISKMLNHKDIVIIEKYRPKLNESEVIKVIGDVNNRDCILLDDIIDTASTLCKSALCLKKLGASKIICYATHPVFSKKSYKNIKNSEIDEFIVCDSIPLNVNIKCFNKIRVLTISKILADHIFSISKLNK